MRRYVARWTGGSLVLVSFGVTGATILVPGWVWRVAFLLSGIGFLVLSFRPNPSIRYRAILAAITVMVMVGRALGIVVQTIQAGHWLPTSPAIFLYPLLAYYCLWLLRRWETME